MNPTAPGSFTRFRHSRRLPEAVGATAIAMAMLITSCSSEATSDTSDPSAQPIGPQASDLAADSSIATEADLDEVNRALIDAARDNDIGLARQLIGAGADVNYKDDTEQSAYLIATSEGYFDLLEITLNNGADVASLDGFNGTGLIRAAERGHADIVGRLLQTEIEVNHTNNLGWTALHEAIILGDGDERALDTVRLLIAGGADVRLPSQRDNVLPLDMALSHEQHDIEAAIRAVLDDESTTDADEALREASSSGDADSAAIALAAGAGIETRDANLRTPLLLSATNDQVGVARILVALGADPDALDDRHDTPWLVTGVTGSVDMAEILLAADPDLAVLNRFGGTSLIPASERGHLAYVARVVQTDVDINHVNDLGWTALMEAVLFGGGSSTHQEIIQVLLAAGADPAIADSEGVTPAEHARTKGYDEIAELLAEE